MRKHRRLINALLAVALVLGLAAPGFAATTVNNAVFSDLAGADQANEMAELGTLGIYLGDGTGKGMPNDTLTRLQQIVVVVRALGKGKLADALASQATGFKDDASIASWGKGHVNVGLAMGLLNPLGYGDSKFHPNDPVTHAQVVAMLVRALKADAFVKGAWPTNYLIAADDLGISTGLDLFANIPATRGEMAKLVLNTINTQNRFDTNGNLVSTGTPILQTAQSSCAASGTVNAVSATQITLASAVDHDCDAGTGTATAITLGDNVGLSGASALINLLNQSVRLLTKSGKIIYAQVSSSNNVTGTWDKFVTTADGLTYTGALDTDRSIKLKDGNSYALAATTLKKNTADDGSPNTSDFATGDSVTLTLNSDGKVTLTQIDRLDRGNSRVTAKSTTATPNTLSVTDKDGNAITVNIQDTTAITLNGSAAALADLAEKDVVDVKTVGAAGGGADAISVAAVRNTVQGKVKDVQTITDSSGTTVNIVLTVDGTDQTIKKSGVTDGPANPAVDDTVKYWLNAAGEARIAEAIAGATQELYVKVTGHQVIANPTGVNDNDTVSFDNRGAGDTKTIDESEGGKPVSGDVGKLGKLRLSAAGLADLFDDGDYNSAKASYVTDSATVTKKITWTAVFAGKGGNTIRIIIDKAAAANVGVPATAGNVTVAVGTNIDITVAGDTNSTTTDGPEVTAAQVVAMINADADAPKYVTVALGGDGTGAVTALTATALAGGDGGTAGNTEGLKVSGISGTTIFAKNIAGTIVQIDNPVVYQETTVDAGDIGSYIGPAGLSIGNVVVYDDEVGTSALVRLKSNDS